MGVIYPKLSTIICKIAEPASRHVLAAREELELPILPLSSSKYVIQILLKWYYVVKEDFCKIKFITPIYIDIRNYDSFLERYYAFAKKNYIIIIYIIIKIIRIFVYNILWFEYWYLYNFY